MKREPQRASFDPTLMHDLARYIDAHSQDPISLEISHAGGPTALGEVLIGATDRGVCFLQLGESSRALLEQLRREFPHAALRVMPPAGGDAFDLWMAALAAFLSGETRRLDLPLDIRGTAFQLKVWKYLQTLPPGRSTTYTQVAEALGRPNAARAVAGACARNRIAIAIPCHRVIRGDGNLAGYRWGLERKRWLFQLEGIPTA